MLTTRGRGCVGRGRGVNDGLADLLPRHDVNDYAASVKVFAVNPR
ncbi:MAG: hypothetical protein NTU53_17580 [Planctomycetota bacterium]|nr:hypothetical protein [Planctomycetota bacterium]